MDEERHGRYYRLIKKFKEQTSCPVIINTSFNIRGEPIVNTPANAYNCFMKTDIDILVLEDNIIFKDGQKKFRIQKYKSIEMDFLWIDLFKLC